MKKLVLISLAVGSLFVLGCKQNANNTNPEGTILLAARAIDSGDQSLLSSILTGQASAAFGNSAGFHELERSFQRMDSIKISKTIKIGSRTEINQNERDSYGRASRTNFDFFNINVQSDLTKMELTVKCKKSFSAPASMSGPKIANGGLTLFSAKFSVDGNNFGKGHCKISKIGKK